MAEPKPSPLDEPLARFARALPLATPGSLPPLAAVLGRGVRWGLGLRSDTRLPFGGTVRLLHWIASPYSDAPDGIVEDCQSARLRQVCNLAGATLDSLRKVLPMPCHRAGRIGATCFPAIG